MIACRTCGESASIEITRDAARPWEAVRSGSSARWAVFCAQCGARWTLVDRA